MSKKDGYYQITNRYGLPFSFPSGISLAEMPEQQKQNLRQEIGALNIADEVNIDLVSVFNNALNS